MERVRNAFLIRVNPAGCINNLPDTLYRNQVSIGWAELDTQIFIQNDKLGTLESLQEAFRLAYPNEKVQKAREIYNFFDLKKGDIVLIPDPNQTRELYIAIINDEKTFISNKAEDIENERRFLRDLIWLNNKQPITYDCLPNNLRDHLTPVTVKDVSKFLPEIFESLLRSAEEL